MFDHRASYLLAAWKMSWAHMRRRIGTLRRMPVYTQGDQEHGDHSTGGEFAAHENIWDSSLITDFGHGTDIVDPEHENPTFLGTAARGSTESHFVLGGPPSVYLGAPIRTSVHRAMCTVNRLFDTYVPDPHPAPPGEQPNFQLILACNPHYLNHLRLLLPGVLTGLTRSHETASYQQARWYSAVINCGNFVQTYHGASPQGRAALLEQATQGALDWVRARPRGPDDPAPLHARFQRGVDSVIHHRAMLMLPLRYKRSH